MDGDRTPEIRPCSESACITALDPAQGELEVSRILTDPDTASDAMPVTWFVSEKPHFPETDL